jgi:hypothetical protein
MTAGAALAPFKADQERQGRSGPSRVGLVPNGLFTGAATIVVAVDTAVTARLPANSAMEERDVGTRRHHR